MHNHSQLDDLLTLLESSTYESNKVLNEDSGDVTSKIVSIFTTIKKSVEDYKRFDADDMNKIAKLISKVSSFEVDSTYGKYYIYPGIENIPDYKSLNLESLFDTALAKIREHSNDPDEEFSSRKIISDSLMKAYKSCTGKDYKTDDTMSESEFKSEFRDYALGGRTKVPRPLVKLKHRVIINLKKVILLIKFIDTKLIYQHINSLNKFQSELITEFKKDKYEDKKYSPFITKYLSTIQNAIDSTMSIYMSMRETYVLIKNEYIRILNYIIDKHESLIKNESIVIDGMNSTVQYINGFTNDLKLVSSKLVEPVLLESGNDDNGNISESLHALSARFAVESSRLHNQFVNEQAYYYKTIGPLLNSFNLNDANDFEEYIYEGINNLADYSDMTSKLDKNYELIEDILKHYNKYTDLTVRDYIMRLVPEEFISCIPFTDVNLVGVLTTNISSKICGDRKYTKPDINVISQNVVSIPKLLGNIDNHINKLNLLISSNINIVPDCENSQSKQMVIQTIINLCFVYLAIILSIYKNLNIIENHSIDVVTAISKSVNDNFPM